MNELGDIFFGADYPNPLVFSSRVDMHGVRLLFSRGNPRAVQIMAHDKCNWILEGSPVGDETGCFWVY